MTTSINDITTKALGPLYSILAVLFAATCLWMVAPTATSAQSPVAVEVGDVELGRAERAIAVIRAGVEKAAADLLIPDTTPAALDAQRAAIEKLRNDAIAEKANLRQPLEDVRQLLAKIGEQPKEGSEEEAGLAERRAELTRRVASLDAADTQLTLLITRAEQASAAIASRQRSDFVRRVFEPGRSVFNPSLWVEGIATIPSFFTRFAALNRNWAATSTADDAGAGAHAGAATLGAMLVAAIAIYVLWTRFLRTGRDVTQVSNFHRVWRAVRVPLFTTLIVGVAFVIINLALVTFGPPPPQIQRLVFVVLTGGFIAAVATALSRASLRPSTPALRLANVDDLSALRLHRLFSATAAIYALNIVVTELADVMFLPLAFSVGWAATASLCMAGLVAIALIVAKGAKPLVVGDTLESGRRFYFSWTRYVFHVVWLVVLIGLLALAAGYVALGHFVLGQLVRTAIIVAGLYLLHNTADALVTTALQTYSFSGRFLRHTIGLGETAVSRLGLLFSTIADLAIVLVGIPVILLQWTLTWIDLKSWVTTAIAGFRVGDITIEPASIILGLLVFLGGIIIARLFSTWLDRRVLSRSGLDTGVRNSIYTGSRYAALVLVGIFAMTVAGVNFANVAIVAGALSVGIGFGLQSIVNNFVSGLILLAERPIKVGDWVSVSGGEGIVKKINVRSTELQTFDRCTVFIPNSSLISEPVNNWYHDTLVGRVIINIGVSYDSDPVEVRRILLECARSHERVLSTPESFVLFQDFGASSLDFSLRTYIDDVGWVSSVASELRFRIFAAFAEAGIEIPFPQSDLHVRTVDERAANAFALQPPHKEPQV